MAKEKKKTALTLDEVCVKLNTYSDLDTMYCIDEIGGNPIPGHVLKLVRDHDRRRLWIVRDIFNERKAREELTERSRVRM